MTPSLHDIVTYVENLERAVAEHPAHARRLLAEAADVWLCLGRRDRAVDLLARLVLLRRRRPRRPVPTTCRRARSTA